MKVKASHEILIYQCPVAEQLNPIIHQKILELPDARDDRLNSFVQGK